METKDYEDVSIKLTVPSELRERWDRFTYDRGYNKSAIVRLFIEAITDPVRQTQVERIIQNQPTTEAQA